MGNVIGFPDKLRDLRAASGLSQQKVADNLGITKVGYQYYEYGKKLPGFGVIARIADLFNVSADYLLGRTDEPQLPDKETLALARQLQAYRQNEQPAQE